MIDVNELLRAKNTYDNGVWYTSLKEFDNCFIVELGIQGTEQGVIESQLKLAEKVVNNFITYKKHGLELITSFIPNVSASEYALHSIDVIGFTNGTHGISEAYANNCFMLTWTCDEKEDFLFTVKFALCPMGCIDEIYTATLEIWRQ